MDKPPAPGHFWFLIAIIDLLFFTGTYRRADPSEERYIYKIYSCLTHGSGHINLTTYIMTITNAKRHWSNGIGCSTGAVVGAKGWTMRRTAHLLLSLVRPVQIAKAQFQPLSSEPLFWFPPDHFGSITMVSRQKNIWPLLFVVHTKTSLYAACLTALDAHYDSQQSFIHSWFSSLRLVLCAPVACDTHSLSA
jgi:hypothetical protein